VRTSLDSLFAKDFFELTAQDALMICAPLLPSPGCCDEWVLSNCAPLLPAHASASDISLAPWAASSLTFGKGGGEGKRPNSLAFVFSASQFDNTVGAATEAKKPPMLGLLSAAAPAVPTVANPPVANEFPLFGASVGALVVAQVLRAPVLAIPPNDDILISPCLCVCWCLSNLQNLYQKQPKLSPTNKLND
jgi:hypothetical protein